MTGDQRCGTYAGYQVHIKHREPPCAPCKLANTRHMRAYRLARARAEARCIRGLGWPA